METIKFPIMLNPTHICISSSSANLAYSSGLSIANASSLPCEFVVVLILTSHNPVVIYILLHTPSHQHIFSVRYTLHIFPSFHSPLPLTNMSNNTIWIPILLLHITNKWKLNKTKSSMLKSPSQTTSNHTALHTFHVPIPISQIIFRNHYSSLQFI